MEFDVKYRILGLMSIITCTAGLASTCFASHGVRDPVGGIYVYGPPTAGESTSVYHYPKSWRGPRYAYPQAYYYKFPPFRRPVYFRGGGIYLDQNFFSGATTNAEIWAIRRKGEVANLPASAREPLPATTRLVHTIGPLPKRELGRGTFERTRPARQFRPAE
jgi:hypothetical protein